MLLAQTVLELQGIPAIPRGDFDGPVRQIAFSRSFGAPTFSPDAVRESVAHYTAVAASKLRAVHEAASFIYIYAHYTAEYGGPEKLPSGYCGHTVAFPVPLTDPISMMRHVAPAVRRIIVPGRKVMKTGVVLFGREKASSGNGP